MTYLSISYMPCLSPNNPNTSRTVSHAPVPVQHRAIPVVTKRRSPNPPTFGNKTPNPQTLCFQSMPHANQTTLCKYMSIPTLLENSNTPFLMLQLFPVNSKTPGLYANEPKRNLHRQVLADLNVDHLGVFCRKSCRLFFHRSLQPNEVFEEFCHIVPHLDQA